MTFFKKQDMTKCPDVSPEIKLQKEWASILGSLSHSCLLTLRETICYVVSCPKEGSTWQGTKGGFWEGISKEMGPSVP